MVFSSYEFIIGFLPIFLLVYFVIPSNIKGGIVLKNIILLIGSLIFYAFGEPRFVFLMLLSIVVNYCIAIKICRCGIKKSAKERKRFWLTISLIFNIGILFYFKYINFVTINLNVLIHKLEVLTQHSLFVLPTIKQALPIGISFYTFQIISYVLDVYYGRIEAETNVINLGTYITMFPQLIAGPIVNYSEVQSRLKFRRITAAHFDRGLKLFILGLGYKVLLANNIGILFSELSRIGYESISTPLAWIGAFAYSFQIYYDFYGYSLMAIGLGGMLGFKIPKNFDNPYISKTATEFWQRWHITLGRWFREYVYIPLGGNRKGLSRMIFNLFVVWLLTGLWHGADWNFIIWGLGYFVILTLEKLFYKKTFDKLKVVPHLYMAILIPVSWIVFAINDLHLLGVYFGRMFPLFSSAETSSVNPLDFLIYLERYAVVLIAAVIFCIPQVNHYMIQVRKKKISVLIYGIVFIVCMYELALGGDNPFLYFRF